MINGFDALVTDWTPELADPSVCLIIGDEDLDRSACRNVTTIAEATGFDQDNFDRAVAPIDAVGAYLDSAKAAEAVFGDQVNRDLGWLYVDTDAQKDTSFLLQALTEVFSAGIQAAACVPLRNNLQACDLSASDTFAGITVDYNKTGLFGLSDDCSGGSDTCKVDITGTAQGQTFSFQNIVVPDIRNLLGGSGGDFNSSTGLTICFTGTITNNSAVMNLESLCLKLDVSESPTALLNSFDDFSTLDYAFIGNEGSETNQALEALLEEIVLKVGLTGEINLTSRNELGTYSMSNMDMSFTFDRESILKPEKGTPVFAFDVASFSSTNLWGETVNSVSGESMFKLEIGDISFLTGSKLTDNVGVPPVLSVTDVTVEGLKPIVDVLKDFALGLVSFSENPDDATAPPVVTAEQWEQIIAEVEAGLVYGGTITSTIQENVVDESGSNVFQTYVVELTSDGSVFVSNLNDNTDLNSETAAMQIYLSGATGYIYAGETLVATAHLGNSQDGMLLSFADGTQRSYTNANPSATSQLDSFFDFITILFPSAEEGTTTN